MNFKKLPKRLPLLLIIAGLALSTLILFCYIARIPIQNDLKPPLESPVATQEQGQVRYGVPVRLRIPRINVNSAIDQVGITSDGTMGITSKQDETAWYKLGQRPGENGSAVIAGHYGGWNNGRGSVFDNLHKLRKGDELYVEDDKGAKIKFVVNEIRNYNPKADATSVFISNDGKSHLNLVTCEGIWDNAAKSYSARLVVFTDKE